MVLSLHYGRSRPDESVETTYTAVQELIDRFESKFGSTQCQQLIGCDLGSEEGQNTFRSSNLIEQCRIYTQEATRMAMLIVEGVN
jgi:hypothetical protein